MRRTLALRSRLSAGNVPLPRPPASQGLYRSEYERDSCGVGMIANMRSVPSHEIVRDANEMLVRMAHRGGCGCEPNTGDGAGMLLSLPRSFLRSAAASEGIELPRDGEYGTGNVFFSHDREVRERGKAIIAERAMEFGLKVLGWRVVPGDNSSLGSAAVASEPHIEQVFLSNVAGHESDSFEFELMRLRKAAERQHEMEGLRDFYVCSLSGRTITYKGQLTPEQLAAYYDDLRSPDFATHMAMVHSRFSTNTFPSWDRAQPNRILCHNGEINTLRGNKNWMKARGGVLECEHLSAGVGRAELMPVCSDEMTDSGNLDSVVELLARASARSLPEAMMMMVPEAWQNDSALSDAKRGFYEYNACQMEPWDGPAMMAFTDGRYLGATLDRNGLRPSRFYVTHDDRVILSSEVGVLPDLPPEEVKIKARLEPGKMFLVDFDKGGIVRDDEVKEAIASARPYRQWVGDGLVRIDEWEAASAEKTDLNRMSSDDLRRQLNAFGYTVETLDLLLAPMGSTGKEALGSMGVDAPLAVLSRLPKLPFEYFKQLFAQVTNPPIDPIREAVVMSLECPVGPEANLLAVGPEHARRLVIPHPILTPNQMAIISESGPNAMFKGTWFAETVDATFEAGTGDAGMRSALDRLCAETSSAIERGAPVVVISHRGVGPGRVPIPSLLAMGRIQHHLLRDETRTQCAIFVEPGDAREVHDMCTLLGFGADAICPYVAYEALLDLNEAGRLKQCGTIMDENEVLGNYRNAIGAGLRKVMSKMGISTLASYKGAQIFEAVGLDDEVMDACFVGTTSRIAGAGFEALSQDAESLHRLGFPDGISTKLPPLANPGDYHYRHGGEFHINDPRSMTAMQIATRQNDPKAWKDYVQYSSEQISRVSIRGMLKLNTVPIPIPMDEVEEASEIVKRFVTGAMSLGSISAESHEALGIAMNRIGAKSNTGEGGEDPRRYTTDENGDLRRSAIKQVASGRFGVTSHYLANSDMIQIKMAQGAKPGEGGELPGHKVTDEIAGVRGTTPGVTLISPPPHHDIYSIEDLAQLIHDLKNAQPAGDVSVKLVSEVGVGIIAAGVAKAKADHITVSGGDGGTGAAAWTGIHRCGLPWELGLAEAQQTLVLNDLRSRVKLQTDGQLKNGRDVVVAALLGAEEFAFSTAPLIAMGCIMMRKCHLNTCPVGIATQDPELRAKFTGQPEHVVNYFFLLAEEVRGYMAQLGFRKIEDMIGRTDKLSLRTEGQHYKSKGLDLSPVLASGSDLNPNAGCSWKQRQDHELEKGIDNEMIALANDAIEHSEPVFMELPINNLNRTVGTMLSYQVSNRHGVAGLPDGTIHVKLNGNAGQSFGFVLASGITLELEGDANDYVGKGLSGGRIVIYPPRPLLDNGFVAQDNVIIGNTCLYGATDGEAFFRGTAGERFAVRNSGARTVVEGVGDHCCEYMTGGRVVVLGETGRNFGAGMSGGIAYVYDPEHTFETKCNTELVELDGASVLALRMSVLYDSIQYDSAPRPAGNTTA